jgi:hypothetical protein
MINNFFFLEIRTWKHKNIEMAHWLTNLLKILIDVVLFFFFVRERGLAKTLGIGNIFFSIIMKTKITITIIRIKTYDNNLILRIKDVKSYYSFMYHSRKQK